MKEWKPYKLNELGKVGRGKSKHRPRNEPSLFGGKYPFIQTGDVKNAEFYISDYSQTYSEKGLAQSKLWKKGTLCITIAANIAETAILNIDACFPDSIIGFIADENKSDVKFIKYHFDLLKLHLQSISQGTTQDNLSQEKLLKFDFTVPIDVRHQQRIASVLSAYDELIEVNNQRIKLLEQTARELYKEWFVRMRFPGYKQAKFKKGVPEGWEIGKIGDLYDVKSGFAFKGELLGEVGFPIIKITNIQNGNIQLENCDRYSGELNKRIEKFELTEGDLIIAMTGAQIGKVGLVSTLAERYFLNQRAGKFFPKKEFLTNNAFAFFTSNSEYFQTMIENYGMGAAQPNISGEQIEKVNCIIPSDDLLEKFTKICEPIFSMSSALKYQNTQLHQIRDRLLPRLISGKLQVKAEKQEAKIVPLQNNNIQTEENNKAKAYFKRRVLAAYIIDHLKNENTFGHVKLMKLMYLCEHLAKIETISNYHRDAAGPYDNQMIRSIDSQLKKARWFECVKENQKYTYRALEKKDEYKSWFINYYAEFEIGIVSLLDIFGKQKTIEAEKVATLYEAYRFLNEKKTTFTDKDILNEVLNNWHESKQRISENEWQNCLNWMREKKWIN